MSIDDAIKQMQEDEVRDRAEHVTKLTPIDYGKVRNIAPQRVYYYIRNNKLQPEECICGRKVIDIEAADKLFGFKKETQPEEDNDGE